MSDDIAIRPENPPVLSARREQNSSPDSPDALVSLAREKIKDGIHEESDGDYNNGREELNEADQLLNQAIQKVTESKNPKKALILAALWMEKGDLEVLRHNDLDGKDCWEKVPHILEGFIPDPEDNFAHTLLYAQVLTRLGEEEKTVTAIRALRFLAETDPDIKSQISKREMVCEYFLGAGKTEEAAKELQIAFDLAKKLSGEEAETVYWEL